MALYRQLKSPSTFIEYRSVSEWKGVVVISNFDSLEAAPSNYRPRRCLVCLSLNSPLPTGHQELSSRVTVPYAACVQLYPPEDEHLKLETCRGD